MKKCMFLLLIIIFYGSCSLKPPRTTFEYRGRTYSLDSLEYARDGNTFTYYLGSSYNRIPVIISLENSGNYKSFDLTINETYQISIGSAYCRILMPDNTEKNIDLTGDSNGRLAIDSISRTFDTTALEISGTEVKKTEESEYEDPYDIASIAAAFCNKKTFSYYSEESFEMRIICFLIGILITGIGFWAVKFPESAAEKNNTSETAIIIRGYFSITLGSGFLIFALLIGF